MLYDMLLATIYNLQYLARSIIIIGNNNYYYYLYIPIIIIITYITLLLITYYSRIPIEETLPQNFEAQPLTFRRV